MSRFYECDERNRDCPYPDAACHHCHDSGGPPSHTCPRCGRDAAPWDPNP